MWAPGAGSTSKRTLGRIALVAAALAPGVALFNLAFGGVSLHIGPLRIASSGLFRPLAAAAMFLAAASWLGAALPTGARAAARRTRVAGIACAVLTLIVGLAFGTGVAGGSDSYGYVSEAYLWAGGTLHVAEPLAANPVLAAAAAPFGYRVAQPGVLVPTYPPGLPLLMALAFRSAGEVAIYWVVPLLGALAVWLTYWIGVRLGGARVGIGGAVLFACSPTFLFQLCAPMTDVPATAAWLAAAAASLSRLRARSAWAGAASSIAILIRPNLAPLVLPMLLLLVSERQPRAIAGFAAGLLPGMAVLAASNVALNGSPLRLGYGDVAPLFAWAWVPDNLRSYTSWLVQVHSSFVLLAFVSPFALPAAASDVTSVPHPRRTAILLLVFCLTVLGCYIGYVPMNGWPFVRFLLPAMPLLYVLAAAVVVRGASIVPARARAAAAVTALGLMAAWSVEHANRLGAFTMRNHERRFLSVGQYVAHHLPPSAIVLSGMHSGSVRLYGGRTSLVWHQIEPADFDAAVRWLRDRGYQPYLLLDVSEEDEFRARLATVSVWGRLDWPPVAEYLRTPGVRLFDMVEPVSPAPLVVRPTAAIPEL
jgi:Dolichyl-phosphate-mannose-protein mannosyltransferase